MSDELQQIMIMLQQLKQDNDTICQENSFLCQQMVQLQATQASTSAPTTQVTQNKPLMSVKAPKMSLPAKFDGNRQKVLRICKSSEIGIPNATTHIPY